VSLQVNFPTSLTVAAAALSVILLVSGCGTASQRGLLEQAPHAAALSSRQLGLLITDYANTFADAVKHSADQIQVRASDMSARRAALLWKIKVVPAVYTAASHEDPLFGLADLWILSIQQRDLMADERTSRVFGAEQAIALTTARHLEAGARAIAVRTLKSPQSLAELEAFVQEFATQHPLADLYFLRTSLAPYYVDFVAERRDVFQEIAAVRDYADTALTLALIGLNHVPEIARWQAELTLLDIDRFPAIGRATQSLDAVGEAATELKGVAADLPAAIDAQRDAVLRDVDRQRVETLRDIERMRRAAFADVAREREAILAGLVQEREAVLAGIEQQLQASLAAVSAERAALTGELPTVAGRAGEAMLPQAREAIDHAFWRAVQLSLLLVVMGTAAIGVLRWIRMRVQR